MFPQLPFSYFDNTDFCFAKLITKNYAERDNGVFLRLLNHNYGLVAGLKGLNDKILAYWNFQSVNLDGDFENQVNIADLPLVATTSDTVAGIIGNGLWGNGNNYAESTDTRLDPQVARFLGFGGWVNTAIDTGSLSTSTTYEEPILSGFATSGYYLRVRAVTDDPVDIGTITYSVVLQIEYDSSPLEVAITTAAVGWNFFYFEINFAAGEAKLSVNAGAFSTISFSEIDTIVSNFYVGGDTSNDLIPTIDEIFVSDEALDLADLAVIYNSGSANAYPF
jgi:hypothetical protein